MLPSTTMNSWSDWLTSGGRISIPISSRLVDEERDLVLRVHHRGDQRGHVLGRVVGLQPRRAVGDQRVAGGVGLVERVVGRLLVGRPQRLDRRPRRVPEARQPSKNSGLSLAIASRFFLPIALRRSSAFGPREAGERLGDLHRLLLVEDHALGRLGDRAQAVVDVGDRSPGCACRARRSGSGPSRPGGRARRARRGPRTRSG